MYAYIYSLYEVSRYIRTHRVSVGDTKIENAFIFSFSKRFTEKFSSFSRFS